MVLLAAMLLLGFTGQAMAYFTAGDLIQVVYQAGGTGNEVLTDLGAVSTTTGPITTGINTSQLSTLFPGQSWSNLDVAYFAFTPQNGGALNLWISGTPGGQTNSAGFQVTTKSALNSVLSSINTASTNQVVQSSSASSSYWNAVDKNGTAVGMFNSFIAGGGEVNLAALASGNTANLSLYYYPTSTVNSAGPGVELETLAISSNGTTTVTPQATPIPATFLLFGSGLLGLVGIRRKQSV